MTSQISKFVKEEREFYFNEIYNQIGRWYIKLLTIVKNMKIAIFMNV